MKSPFGEDVRKLIVDTINRLVNLKKSTPRLRLRQHFKGHADDFDKLIQQGFLVVREQDSYVPGIMAFEACGDDFLLSLGKESVRIVLHALQHLYETESPKTSFTVQEIEEHARKLCSGLEEEKIPLGLSLIADVKLMILGGWNNDGAVITEVHVREDVIDFTNIEDFWSRAVQVRLADPVAKSLRPEEQRRLDPLLGILDRGEFDNDAMRFSRIASEHKPTSLIMGDVDSFKTINDSRGHPVGDEVLQTVAKVLRTACDGKGHTYRYGGDEFAILLPNFSVEEAAALADRIRETVLRMKCEQYPEPVTTSWGVAALTDSEEDAAKLVKMADDALYKAKRDGKNRVALVTTQRKDEPETVSAGLLASQEAIDVRVESGHAQAFSIVVNNNADQEFVVIGVLAEHEGSALGKINRAAKGWLVPARGRVVISWLPDINVSGELVRLVGEYKQQYAASIDFVFHCRVAGSQKQFRKRVRVQVDPMNKYLFSI